MDNKNLSDLMKIAAILRKKCPWDRERTIPELVPDLEEEVKEIAEAIEKKDWENLEEEIGDTLFCLMLMTQIATEKKLFNLDSICKKVTKKLIRRHSWVFGKDKVKTSEEAVKLWKKNKEKQKK